MNPSIQMLMAQGAVAWATFDPVNKGSNVTLSNGNLTAAVSGGVGRTNIGKSAGKWYVEITMSAGDNIGICNGSVALGTDLGFDGTNGYGYYAPTGERIVSAGTSAYGASYTAGDTIGIYLNMDAGTCTMYKNNVSQGNIATGLTGTWYFAVSRASGTKTYTINAGASAFTYTPPTGAGGLK